MQPCNPTELYMKQKTKIWIKTLGVISAIILALTASGVFNSHKKEVKAIHTGNGSKVSINQDADGNTPPERVHKKVDDITTGDKSPVEIKQ